MHLLALGAFCHDGDRHLLDAAQVLMHLLVLGAFWHETGCIRHCAMWSLNAPFGARCFLTRVTQESYFVRILAS